MFFVNMTFLCHAHEFHDKLFGKYERMQTSAVTWYDILQIQITVDLHIYLNKFSAAIVSIVIEDWS